MEFDEYGNPIPGAQPDYSFGQRLGNFFGVGPESAQLNQLGLSDPRAAAWSQALNNIVQMNMGQAPQTAPYSAAFDVRRQNAILMDRKYQNMEQERRWKEGQRMRDLQLQAAEFTNKTNAEAVPNPYQNLPQNVQEWELSGAKARGVPFEKFLESRNPHYFAPTQPTASMQDYQFYNSLSEEGKKQFTAMQPGYSPKPVKIGDVTYMVDPATGAGKAVGPEGAFDFDDINQAIQSQAAKKAGAVASAKAQGEAKGSAIAGAPARNAELDQMLSIVDQLQKDPSLDAVYGTLDGALPTGRQESVDAENRIQSLIAKLSLDARAKLAGQGSVSNFEGEQLGRSATTLGNYRASGGSAREELNNIKQILLGAKARTSPLTQTPDAAPASTDGWKIERVE